MRQVKVTSNVGLEISEGVTFIVGQPAAITCTSAIAVDELIWLDQEGNILFSSSSGEVEIANLDFSPVNDSIHNKRFTCRAVLMGTVEKDINVSVSSRLNFHLYVLGIYL